MSSSAPFPPIMTEDENTTLLSENPTEKTCTSRQMRSMALCFFGGTVLGAGVGAGLATCVEAGLPTASINLAHWAMGGAATTDLVCVFPYMLWKNCVETPEKDQRSPLPSEEQRLIN